MVWTKKVFWVMPANRADDRVIGLILPQNQAIEVTAWSDFAERQALVDPSVGESR